MENSAALADLNLIADNVCVDFVNTVERGVRYQHQDWLGSYKGFLLWSRKAGVIDSDEFTRLETQSSTNRSKVSRVFEKILRLRALLRGIFAAISSGSEISTTAIKELNEFLTEAHLAQKLEWIDQRAIWRWRSNSVAMERPLWTLVIAAADLLTSENLQRVRRCANPQCSWMFVDTSKNKKRRWCEMDVCGNQAKARGHYARHRPST
jgi:predicted RNA-binding Zn ribbon-like protein